MNTRRIRSVVTMLVLPIVFSVALLWLFGTKVQATQSNIIPLPNGCIGSSPVGGEIPVCCINGMVFLNGEAVSGAEVTIQGASGLLKVLTQRQAGDDERPYYRASLSSPPLSAAKESVITITANYSGLSKTVTHTVQDGSQQVDLTLSPSGLSIGGAVNEQPTPGKFNIPRDVAVSSRGNIYVLDQHNFRIQVYNSEGTLLSLPKWQKQFGNLADQWSSETLGIAIDQRTDTVYIADNGNQRIARYNAEGDLLGIWNGSNTDENVPFSPKDVSVDRNGNVYALVNVPGTAPDAFRLYKFDVQNNLAKRWDIKAETNSQFENPSQLTVSANGEVYVSESKRNAIYRFDALGHFTVFNTSFAPGLENSSPISLPMGIAVDTGGNLYLADRYTAPGGYRHRVLKVEPSGQIVTAWNYPFSVFVEAKLEIPSGMAVGGNMLYIGDIGNGKDRLARIEINGNLLDPWGGTDTGFGRLSEPKDIVIAPATVFPDQLFVADCDAQKISVISGTTIVQSWNYTDAGRTTRWCPSYLAFDNQNRLFVMDRRDQYLMRYQINGSQLVQDGGPWYGRVGNSSIFSGSVDFALDSQNRIYMADQLNQRLVVYTIQDNQTLSQVATFDGIGSSGQFTNPQGIAIDASDLSNVLIFVADTGNNRLLKLKLKGSAVEHLATWGDQSHPITCSNVGTTTLKNPRGLLMATDGFLYVADKDYHRVLKLNPAGDCLQILGDGTVGTQPGKLYSPDGLAVDAQGRLYVSGYSGIVYFTPPQAALPIATISHISANAIALQENDILEIIGQGQASMITGSIAAFHWSSSLDGDLNAKNTSNVASILRIPAQQLQPGLHQVSLTVTDDQGRQSLPVEVQVRRLPKMDPLGECKGETWSFLLYLVGDFSDSGALRTLYDQQINRLSQISNPCVRIAIQVDGPANMPQPNNLTQRIAITPGMGLSVTPMNELQMDDAQTLHDFVLWGQNLFPTQHYYLAIANHGQGIRGIGWDKTSGADEFLTPREIASALFDARIVPIDILHLDACSMGLLDVAYELRDSADFLIASQYIVWSFFAYPDYIEQLPANQTISPKLLSEAVLDEYARLANASGVPFTLSLLNPARSAVVKSGISALSDAMIAWAQRDAANAATIRDLRQRLPTIDSNGDLENRPDDVYIDLVNLLQILTSSTIDAPEIKQRAQQLLFELNNNVVQQPLILAHQSASQSVDGFYNGNLIHANIDLSHTHGISIYFPLEKFAPAEQLRAGSALGYTKVYSDYLNLETPYQDFTRDTRWEDMLYTALGGPGPGDEIVDTTPPLAPIRPPTRVYLPAVMR